jgi:protein O-mannosyl-transferase
VPTAAVSPSIPPRSPPGVSAFRAPQRESAWALFLLFATLIATYFPALQGGMVWDDDAHITPPALRSLHGLHRIWGEVGATQQYYPVLHTAFWFEHRLWGDHVLGYHLVNVLLHGIAACLLGAILRRLAIRGAWLAAFVFALHPVMVESVAWISEQKNTLSAVWYLGAALAYLRFASTRRRREYALASALFVLALLTKTVTATLPAALLVVAWWRNGRLSWKRDVLPVAPWFVAAIPAGLFTAWVERHYIGAQGAEFTLAAGQRLLLAGNVLAFYLGKLIWPARLMFVYPRWTIDLADPMLYVAPALVVVLFAMAAWFARRRRAPLAALLFFAGTLVPVLGFVNVYPFIFSYVANHFQYLASIGIIVPITAAVATLAARFGENGVARGSVYAALLISLATLSWHEAQSFRDAKTLYRTTLHRNPACWLAHFNLAVLEEKDPRELSDAIAHYQATIRLNPDHWAAHNNLGSAWLKFPARLADATAEFETALRLHPDFPEAHNNLGVALDRMPGHGPEAIAHFRTAVRLRPDYLEALVNLGNALASDPSQLPDAIGAFETALRLDPNDAAARLAFANALMRAPGRLPDAIAQYRRALELRPAYREARNNLGAALARAGQIDDAIAQYRAALALDPNDAATHVNLANALVRSPNGLTEALAEYRAAVRLSPNEASMHYGLAVALSDVRDRWPEARTELERALQLQPEFPEAHYCLAVVLLRMGIDRDTAIRHLEVTVAQKPTFEPARRLLARLTRE